MAPVASMQGCAAGLRPEDSGKGNCRHGRRPQPAAARPRRPKARKTGAPTIKPTARQFASLRRIPSSMYHPRAYHGCRGALACACAPSSRARRTSQGANGAFQDRTNGHQAAAHTIRDALARIHHTTRRENHREILHRLHTCRDRTASLPFWPPTDPPHHQRCNAATNALLPRDMMPVERKGI